MYREIVPKVVKMFVVDVVRIGSVQKGYRNESYRLTLSSGENVNLIFHKYELESLSRIQLADQASALLKGAYPIRTRYDNRTLRLSDSKKTVYAGLYTYLPGATIPWEAYTKDHIKLLGWAMSDIHYAWSSSGATSEMRITDELGAMLNRMERYFSSPGVISALRDKLNLNISTELHNSHSIFNKFDQMPDAQEHILHMDFVRGNVLFDTKGDSPWVIGDTTVTGVIDFEKAAMGQPVFDIARTLAFLLVDCANKDRQSIFKYFLQSGYNKRGKGSFHKSSTLAGMPAGKTLNLLISFFLLHDFYKFLKHTPYESLEGNHHFIRTRDILIEYGMIRLIKTDKS